MDTPDIRPFTRGDVEFFYDSTYLRFLHRQKYRGHEGHFRSCGTCYHLAYCSLACLAGTARHRGESRDQFIEGQRALGFDDASNPIPQRLLTTYVRRGVQMYLPQIGRAAKPAVAARGSKLQRAMVTAHADGRLSVDVEIAHHLLEQVIRVVQADGEPRTESGRILPYGYISHRVQSSVAETSGVDSPTGVTGGPGALPEGWSAATAARVWHEIVKACEDISVEGELDRHVFRHSAHLSTAFLWPGAAEGDHSHDDLLDEASMRAAETAIDSYGERDRTATDGEDPDGEPESVGSDDAVYQWAQAAADDVRDDATPLDALPSAVERRLAGWVEGRGGDAPTSASTSTADTQKQRRQLRRLTAAVLRQATRIVVWDEVVERAVRAVPVGGRLEFDRLDLVVDMFYEMLCEESYPFEEEERTWSTPSVRHIALRGWAQRIIDRSIRPS